MALITTTATFNQYLKVSFTLANTGLPDMEEAAYQYLIPVLGKTVYDALNTHVQNNSTPDAWKDFLHYSRRVVAPAGFLIELSTKHIRLTDAGLKKASSENTESVFKWEYYKVEEELKNKLAVALDDLWQHLYANGSTYSWTDPSPVKIAFKTAKDFNNYFPLYQPYRVFNLFKPIIAQVEELFIIGAIGEEFFNELKDDSGNDANMKKAIDLVKKAVAYYTIYKSVEKLPVKYSDQGLTVLLSSAPDKSYDGEQKAPDNQLSLLYHSSLKDGNTYLNKLKKYLNENASLSVFPTYYASDFYKDPATAKVCDANAKRKGVFGL